VSFPSRVVVLIFTQLPTKLFFKDWGKHEIEKMIDSAIVKIVLIMVLSIIFANGPAIKGGCVTRRKHRAGSWYFSQKAVTVQGGYGALFAVQVQIL